MSINPQSITKAQFQATLELGGVAPGKQVVPFILPINFDQLSNLNLVNGTYTPNNDYRYLLNSIPAGQDPNFFILICDSPCSMSMIFTKNSSSYAYNRFAFISWVHDPANPLTNIFIDGRTNPNPGVTPMAQNQVCNYTFIYGQASIS